MHPARLVAPRPGALMLLLLPSSFATSHLQLPPVHWVNERDTSVPLQVTSYCNEDIYPAIHTQGGTGPSAPGFLLSTGQTHLQAVSADWQGRVWARTNCSFNADGSGPASGVGAACTTGDCGGAINCTGVGEPPATLAEFTLLTSSGQTFYDLSLVDGYNIPVGLVYKPGQSNNPNLTDIPPNLTNPMCIGTAALLASQDQTEGTSFGTNSSYPLPFDTTVSDSDVQGWCPWDLQQSPPQKPGDGIYPYPDDNIQRPLFNPCYSACARWGGDAYCCTGKHGSSASCSPSYYSTQAKKVCPDAYSYAYDDSTSTFVIPSGGGFEVVFCPPGRSTTILQTFGNQLSQVGQTGQVTPEIIADTQNRTLIKIKNEAAPSGGNQALLAMVVLLAFICFMG